MIFNRGYFRSNAVGDNEISKSLNEVRLFSATKESKIKPTIFLSHKHDDLEDLKGVMGMLESFGAKIYIDSMDNKMSAQTCGDTAKRIKDVIKFCDKFILLATAKAIESYWCNWELGFGDTHKYHQHMAIIPIKESGQTDSQYKGNEYLQIYPQIDYENGTQRYGNGSPVLAGYYISRISENTRFLTPLKDWLQSK